MNEHERTPDDSMSSHEIEIQQNIYDGEGSEGIESIEMFLAAKKSLHAQIEDMMQGEGESAEAVEAYLNDLLIESAQGFAHTVQLAEATLGAKLEFGSQLLLQSLLEIKQLSDKYNCGILVDTSSETTNEITEAFEQELTESTEEADEFKAFEQVFGALHMHLIDIMINRAPSNKNDQRKHRQMEFKAKALGTAKETAKIALGAGMAVLAIRFFDKK